MAVALELVITAFLGIVLISQIISSKTRFPYTIVLVIAGIAITSISSLMSTQPSLSFLYRDFISQLAKFYNGMLQQGIFVGLIVPPLIFDAMMRVSQSDLRYAIRPSLLLATAGVVISTLVCGYILWRFAGLDPATSFLFAAIISPTDTATILEIFKRARVSSRLSAILELETALNDATAIVVFSLIMSSVTLAKFPVVGSIINFTYILLGGLAVGSVISLLSLLVNKMINESTGKVILTASSVYGSYVLASGLGFSGLIAVAFVGLFFGNRIVKNEVDEEKRRTILTFWELAAFFGNSIAFLFIGFQTNVQLIYGAIIPIFVAYLSVVVSRLVSVYPILGIMSRITGRIPVDWSNVAFIGGIRGAISIALAASVTEEQIPGINSSLITTMTVGVVFFSILLQVPLLLRYMKTHSLL